MTFLSTQNFDENGEVHGLSKVEREITLSEERQPNGLVKGKMKNKFKTEPYTAADAIAFGNVAGAEAHVLTEGEVFWGLSAPPIRHIKEEYRSAQRISNAMANIATKTGRGAGNTVVYHPDFAEAIEQAKVALKTVKVPQPGPNHENDPNDVEMVEQEVPYFQDPDSIDWIEHTGAPEDKVLVMYRGTEDSDQPLIYVEGAGLILNDKLSAVDGYGKFTKVT